MTESPLPVHSTTDAVVLERDAAARKRLRGPKLIAAIVIGLVVASVAGVWVNASLISIDESVSAAGGQEYTTDAYTVLLPGRPETATQKVPGTDFSLETATWQNKQKVYAVAHSSVRGAISLEDALAGSLQGSAATLVDSESVSIDGGTALAAQSTVDDLTLWSMIVFTDDGGFVSLSHNGDERDDAFFESFRLN